MTRHARHVAFVILTVVVVLSRTAGASGCNPWNTSILSASGTCDSCWTGALACRDNCDSWGAMLGPQFIPYVENFQCYELDAEHADVFCNCYYFYIPD